MNIDYTKTMNTLKNEYKTFKIILKRKNLRGCTLDDYLELERQLIESKNLYNSLLYISRAYFIKKSDEKHNRESKVDLNGIYKYGEYVENLFKEDKFNIKNDKTYYYFNKEVCKINNINLPSKVKIGVMKEVAESWKGYFEIKKSDKVDKKKVNIPGYKEEYGVCKFNNQSISKKGLKKGKLILTGMKTGVNMPKWYIEKFGDTIDSLVEVKVLKRFNTIELHVVYKEDVCYDIKDKERIASIDLGMKGLLTITFNFEQQPIVIKAPKILRYNQWYNKELRRLKSKLPEGQYMSKRIENLTLKRNRRIENILGEVSNELVKILESLEVGRLVIGYNKGFKDGINLGNKTNQNFVGLPLRKLLDKIQYKMKWIGVEYIEQEESYTSVSSYIDNDEIPVYNEIKEEKEELKYNKEANKERIIYKFSGKRISRGMYRSRYGVLIQADVNGSYNILRKYLLKGGVEGVFGEMSKLLRMVKGNNKYREPYGIVIR